MSSGLKIRHLDNDNLAILAETIKKGTLLKINPQNKILNLPLAVVTIHVIVLLSYQHNLTYYHKILIKHKRNRIT